MKDGFNPSVVRDCAEHVCFTASSDPSDAGLASAHECAVVIDLEDAERFRHLLDDGEPYLDNYKVPVALANERPRWIALL